MKKILKYGIIIAIVIAVLVHIAPTVRAGFDNYITNIDGSGYVHYNMISYNDQMLYLHEFVDNVENNTYKSEFLDTRYDIFLNGGFLFSESPIYRKISACFTHSLSSSSDINIYRVKTVIDVDYDEDEGRILAKSYTGDQSRKSSSEYAGELGYSIYLNDTNGSEGNTFEKDYVNYMVSEGANDGEIITTNEFTQKSYQDNVSYMEYHSLREGANDYINKINNYRTIKSENLDDDPDDDSTERNVDLTINNSEYTVVGPFRISYGIAGVESIALNDGVISNKNGNVYWVENGQSNYKDPSIWKSNVGDIPSWQYFYLAIKKDVLPNNSTEYNIKFNQDSSFTFYKSRVLLLDSSSWNQQLAVFTGSENTVLASIEYTIGHKTEEDKGKITIVKRDQKDQNDIKGVKLKIYGILSNGSKGWIKKDGEERKLNDGTQGFNAATEWTTNNNGQVVIDRLDNGTYYIYEVSAGEGYSLENQRTHYPDSEDSNKFAGRQEYGKAVYLSKTEINKSTKKVTIKRKQYLPLELIIEKVDAKNRSKKLSGVKLKLYGEQEGTKGWVKSDGTISNKKEDAAEWVTGSDRKSKD